MLQSFMKKLFITLILLAIGIAVLVPYFSLQKIERRYYKELNHMAYQNWINSAKSGLVITHLTNQSVLTNVQFLNDFGMPTDNGPLIVGDSITGITLDQQKTRLIDFILGKRSYAHLARIYSEEALYNSIIKFGSNTILLGIVRPEENGFTHNIVRVSLGELCKNGILDLGITVVSSTNEVGQKKAEESDNSFNFKECYVE